jgi:hypothetical protein
MSHKRTSGADEGDRADRAQEIGLFRYALIRPVADRLSDSLVRSPFRDRILDLVDTRASLYQPNPHRAVTSVL